MATADITVSHISREKAGKSADYSGEFPTDRLKSSNMADEGAKTKRGADGEAEAVEFNLSDPDQLARQLDRVDLTEEESDELLREAYKVNKQLKMMLKQKQDKLASSLRSQSASSSTAPKGGSSILPPIHAKGGGAVPLRSQKAYGQSLGRSAGSSAATGKSQSKTKKTKSPPHRQEWDDRFSFS